MKIITGDSMRKIGLVLVAGVLVTSASCRPAPDAAPQAAVRVVGRFAEERTAGESFRSWMDRSGGAKGVAATLEDLAEFPDPEEHPEFYVDYDETGPYVAEVGESECAT